MPTFSNIDGEESATVTFTVGAVQLTRNSSAELQEILCIGDPEVASSLGLARVVNTAPNSTMAGLAVRIIGGPSTVADFPVRAVLPSTATDNPVSLPSSQTINVRSSAANALMTVYQSTATELRVALDSTQVSRVNQGIGNSSAADEWLVKCSSLSTGHVTVDTGTVRVHHITSSGASLTTNADPGSTSYGIIVRPVGGSTDVSINGIADASTAVQNSSRYIPVRLTNSTAFLDAGTDFTDGSTYSTLAGPGIAYNNGTNATFRVVGLTQPLPVQLRTSSGGDISGRIVDRDESTKAAAVLSAAPASTAYGVVVRMPAGYVAVTEYTDAQTTIAGINLTYRDSSAAVRGVASTRGLPVNIVAGTAGATEYTDAQTTIAGPNLTYRDSSGAVRGVASTRALPVNVVAGSAAGTEYTDAQSTIAGGALIYKDSSGAMRGVASTRNLPVYDELVETQVAGAVTELQKISAGFADEATAVPTFAVYCAGTQGGTLRGVAVDASGRVMVGSTAAELNVTVAGYSTTVNVSSGVIKAQVNTSSGGGVEGSTTAPAVGVTGLHVRQVFPTMQSTTIVVTSTHSTAIYPIVSSVAGLRHKCYAYFIGSTHTNPSTLLFCSSASGSDFNHWHVNFGSGSSGITGANMALTPPGFIFAGVSQNALNIKIEGGSSVTATVVARVSLSWFDEA